ncbi:MAG: hypothetical protein NTY68_04920 [Candidatus Micrarchaeota archaeon]|nr:hypothetical protein [Candidatus Micrarchaeota archaeon]
MGQTKLGQSGIELLFVMGIMTTIFIIIMLVSYQAQSDTAALSADFEAQRICHEISFRISTVDAAGNGTSARLGLPEKIAGSNYTVFVSGQSQRISILYANGVAGCMLPALSIANGTGIGSSSNFYVNGDMPLRNIGQGVVVG